MQCKCGATLTQKESIRSAAKLKLEWQQCGKCGRSHPERLKRNGETVATGWDAFRMYEELA